MLQRQKYLKSLENARMSRFIEDMEQYGMGKRSSNGKRSRKKKHNKKHKHKN